MTSHCKWITDEMMRGRDEKAGMFYAEMPSWRLFQGMSSNKSLTIKMCSMIEMDVGFGLKHTQENLYNK